MFFSSLHSRCSSCFCSVDRASSGCRSGTCLCRTRRKRRSPESWCRRSWLESPRCAASWSGGTSRLCIRGVWKWGLFVNKTLSGWTGHRTEHFPTFLGKSQCYHRDEDITTTQRKSIHFALLPPPRKLCCYFGISVCLSGYLLKCIWTARINLGPSPG